MPASDTSVAIPLSEPEHYYAALDGVAGTMGSTYMIRLDTPVPADQVKAVARELVSALPRFRGIVERGPWRSHLRILPDDVITDQLFEEAWHVEAHIDAGDPQAVERYHNRLINEGLPLERGMACRFRYIPHVQQPVLFVVLHHLLFDGRSGVYVLSAIVKRLNEAQPITPVPPEYVPMLGAMRPHRWWQWPVAIRGELRYRGQEKARLAGVNIQMVNRQDQPYLSTYAVRHYTAPCTTAQLRSVGRKLGLTATALITLILAEAFLSQAPDDPKAAAVIRQALDLRPYQPKDQGSGPMLGNQVGSFLVTLVGQQTLTERAAAVKEQLRAGLERYDKRQMGFGIWLGGAIIPWLGTHLMAHAATKLQRQLKMPRISCYATHVGNLTAELSPPEARIKALQFYGCGPSGSMLHGMGELGDQLTMPLVWQRCEATDAEIDAYLHRLTQAFDRILREGAATEGRQRKRVTPQP